MTAIFCNHIQQKLIMIQKCYLFHISFNYIILYIVKMRYTFLSKVYSVADEQDITHQKAVLVFSCVNQSPSQNVLCLIVSQCFI